ncbi:MAG: hypothetical protein U9O64_04275 [Campylobacterota bacterium]|nr:hypothetical protein [Campylobacterota bacterium]
MSQFVPLKCDNDLKEIIQSAFDSDFDLSGAWGYTQDSATHIHSTDLPLSQIEHILASMRAYLEMNMTLSKEDRYGSINLNELDRRRIQDKKFIYDKVKYEITAMREKTYNAFIHAYKEGYGTEGFDMEKHFEERKEATLKREVVYWFEIHQTLH